MLCDQNYREIWFVFDSSRSFVSDFECADEDLVKKGVEVKEGILIFDGNGKRPHSNICCR